MSRQTPSLEDIDEYDLGGYCDDEATCANLPGSYTCSCPVGYIGDGKGSPNGCVDKDECSDGALLAIQYCQYCIAK